MISRREIVTAGVIGSFAAATPAEPAAAEQSQSSDAILRDGLKTLSDRLEALRAGLDQGLIGPSLSAGYVSRLRDAFKTHLRSSGKFPEFCEVGILPFYDVYDWHVKHMQQIVITRAQENRMAIQFMFTQLILRYEQDERYIGQPYDR